jgi:hypothetical protein
MVAKGAMVAMGLGGSRPPCKRFRATRTCQGPQYVIHFEVFLFLCVGFVGVIYHGYRGPLVIAKNSGYDRFPLVANDWRTIHHVPGNGSTTPG